MSSECRQIVRPDLAERGSQTSLTYSATPGEAGQKPPHRESLPLSAGEAQTIVPLGYSGVKTLLGTGDRFAVRLKNSRKRVWTLQFA